MPDDRSGDRVDQRHRASCYCSTNVQLSTRALLLRPARPRSTRVFAHGKLKMGKISTTSQRDLVPRFNRGGLPCDVENVNKWEVRQEKPVNETGSEHQYVKKSF